MLTAKSAEGKRSQIAARIDPAERERQREMLAAKGIKRTDEGYAFWKEDPRIVAAARAQAKGVIGARTIRRLLVDSWAAPAVDWINRKLARHDN